MMISMRIFLWLFLIFGLSICITLASSKEIRVVCYYTNWSVYRPGTAKFSPQNINPYLCTHLIYAFGGFTKENTLKPFDKYQDMEKGGYAKFTGLKTYNKDLKTLLAIGGWNEASSRFSPMVASADRRKQLVKNSIKFLRQNHFDGLDLDWEYPAFREGGKPRDKENYAKLVQELREEFERESEKTGRTRLLLTMAVPAGIEYINKGYDIPKLTKYLDWMNILSYDYHSAFEPAVNHHAPLYPLREATEYDYDAELNIDYTIKHYLELGADPSKLVMGIPTYGRSYTLFNPDASAIGDPADGPGEMGEATRENGYLAYYEICENVKSNDWTVVQSNDKAMGPYAYKENQWVGYDDENIARKKAEYVAENGLGGIMFWAIDNDDFRGSCHGKPYPLIEAAKEALIAASGLTDNNLISPPSKPAKSKSRLRNRQKTTEEPSTERVVAATKSSSSRRRNRLKPKANNKSSDSDTKPKSRRNESKKAEETSTYSSLKVITPAYTTPEPPATPDQGGAFKCEDEGFFPHPKDCKKYFWCLSGPGELGIVAHQFTCPAGLFFNKAADSCDYSQNVLCNKKLSKTTSTTEGKKVASTTTERISTTTPTKRTTQITTTTEAEYDDEYEYEDDEVGDSKSDSEEDPKVIKELLDLIKKAGGIEELEKQLHISHDEVKEGATTPSTRTKSLVEKFLNSRSNKNSPGANKYTTINRNSRGPQNAGIERVEVSTKNYDRKPQYTSISRKTPTSTKDDTDNQDDLDEDEKSVSRKYTTIQRSKEGLTTVNRQTLDRNKILGEGDKDPEDSNRKEVTVHTTPQYVNIRRQRPTTAEQESSTSKYVSIRRSTTAGLLKEEQNEKKTSTSRYVSLRRSTTSASPKEEDKDETTTARKQATDFPSTERLTPTFRYQTVSRQSESTTETSSSSAPTTITGFSSTLKDIITTVLISSTRATESEDEIKSSPAEVDDEPISSTTAITETSPIEISTEEQKQTTKAPVLFEPRPFSVERKSTISTTYKPVRSNIRSTTSPSKVSDPSVRSRFRRPFPNNSVDNNSDGVSDNSVESDNSREVADNTVRPLRTKSRFTRPDIEKVENSKTSPKPAFRQRKRPVFISSTPKTLSDNEQDEFQRKYRPLSLDDLSSLTAADIAIQKGNKEGGFRRTRIRSTTAETTIIEDISTTTRKTLERTRPPSTAKNINLRPTGNPIHQEQNEIKTTVSDYISSTDSFKNRVSTTRRRILNRTRIAASEESTTEISNDLNDQVKSGSDEVQFAKENRDESTSSSTEFIRRPPKRMRKVLKRLRTSKVSPTTSDVTSRGKPLSYSSLNLELITTSQKSDVVVVDTDSNESNLSDETIEDGENIKLSATNIRENSDINNNNAIYDIGFRKFKKADVVFDKTRYGNKKDVLTATTTQATNSRTRKIVRRLRPTESTLLKERTEAEQHEENNREAKQNRGRKVIRRLRPSFKPSAEGNSQEDSLVTNQGSFINKNRAPQFFEKRGQYPNRDNVQLTKTPTFRIKNTTSRNDLNSTPEIFDRSANGKLSDSFLSEETEAPNVERTSQSLRYNNMIRGTRLTTSSGEEKEISNAEFFSTPHSTTFSDDPESTTPIVSEFTSPIHESQESGESTETLFRTYQTSTQSDEPSRNTPEKTEETSASTITLSEQTTIFNPIYDSKEIDAELENSNSFNTTETSFPTTVDENDEDNNYSSTSSNSFETTTAEYIRKSTLRSLRLRPTYQIRRSTTTELPTENKLPERSAKFFTRKKPSFRQKSTTESSLSQSSSSEKPRRRYPFSKGRFSTTASVQNNSITTEKLSSKSEINDLSTRKDEEFTENSKSEVNTRDEKPAYERQKFPKSFSRYTTEPYPSSTILKNSSDSAEKQRLRNKSLFSKTRKMNSPVNSSAEVKQESTTELYTTLYHVFAEPDVDVNETKVKIQNETHMNSEERIEPLIEINRIIEVHIKNGNDNSSGVNNEAKSIFDKIGAINRVTSIHVVDGNGTKIADLPLDQTNQRLAVVHDIIAQEKKNEVISDKRKDRKFDLKIKNTPINELTKGESRPEIIDGISHIKVITPKPLVLAEASTIALEALFTTTERAKNSVDKIATTASENELLDTEFSRFVNIRVIKPVDGRSLGEVTSADTPKVVRILSSDEGVTMEAKVVEVTPKNSDEFIRIAPIQVAMARTIADTPVVGINRLNEKISNMPFRPSDASVN